MFNAPHWHIAINHLPVVGFLAALIMALCALFLRSRMLILTAWMTTILSCVTGAMTYLSGEPAEEALEEASSISHAYLSAHERWGEWTYYAALGVLLIALAGWFIQLRTSKPLLGWLGALTVLLLVANGMGTVTATLGGGIRHTEAHGDKFGEMIQNLAFVPEELEMLEEEPVIEIHESDDGEESAVEHEEHTETGVPHDHDGDGVADH